MFLALCSNKVLDVSSAAFSERGEGGRERQRDRESDAVRNKALHVSSAIILFFSSKGHKEKHELPSSYCLVHSFFSSSYRLVHSFSETGFICVLKGGIGSEGEGKREGTGRRDGRRDGR